MNETLGRHTGGCHCGAVRFECAAPLDLIAYACNCSICHKCGFQHVIVPEADFTLLKGHDQITEYSFNTRVAKHWFCKICGIKPYYRPRSNPNGISVNARCLELSTIRSLQVKPFDGQNWEDNVHKVKHLT